MAGSRYEYVRKYEADDRLLPGTWIVVRVDGKGFTKHCERHNYVRPNDDRGIGLMNGAAESVMKVFGDIIMAYGQSDEYSFVFKRDTTVYGRRASKLCSVIASTFAANFVLLWPKFFPDSVLDSAPAFDGRCVAYPSVKTVRDYLSWRQVDCHINNLFNTTFWALVQKGGQSTAEAYETLKGTLSDAKNEILFSQFGINYAKEAAIHRKGSFWYRPFLTMDSRKGRGPIVLCHEDVIGDAWWKSHPNMLGPEVADELSALTTVSGGDNESGDGVVDAGKKRLSRSGGRPSKSLAKKGGPPPIPKHSGGRERASTTDKRKKKKDRPPSIGKPSDLGAGTSGKPMGKGAAGGAQRRSKQAPNMEDFLPAHVLADMHRLSRMSKSTTKTTDTLSRTDLKSQDSGWKTLSFQSYGTVASEKSMDWVGGVQKGVSNKRNTHEMAKVARHVYDDHTYGELEKKGGFDRTKNRTGDNTAYAHSAKGKSVSKGNVGLYRDEPYSDEDSDEFRQRMAKYGSVDMRDNDSDEGEDDKAYVSDDNSDPDDQFRGTNDDDGFDAVAIDPTKIVKKTGELKPCVAVMGGRLSKQGFMYKKGGGVFSWKRRYFCLKDHILCYFYALKDSKPLGIILLDNCKITAIDPKDHSFSVTHEKRDSYTFKCDTHTKALNWVKFLKEATTKAKEVDMAGYLTKQGGGFKSWKRRLFVLRGDMLFYFVPDESLTLAGFIPLEGASVDGAYGDTKKEFSFSISHAQRRTFYIHADNEEEMDAWINAIQFAAKPKKGGARR